MGTVMRFIGDGIKRLIGTLSHPELIVFNSAEVIEERLDIDDSGILRVTGLGGKIWKCLEERGCKPVEGAIGDEDADCSFIFRFRDFKCSLTVVRDLFEPDFYGGSLFMSKDQYVSREVIGELKTVITAVLQSQPEITNVRWCTE